MSIAFDSAWVMAVLLCTLRLSALLMLTPVLQALQLPVRIRVLLMLGLAVCFVSGMHLTAGSVPSDVPGLMVAGIHELLVGAMMAFGVFTAFAAFSFAGSALDIQTGFNIANVFDPVTRSQSPLLASLFSMVAVALFFGLDAHHVLLRGIAFSFERVPLGASIEVPEPGLVVSQFGSIFTFGLLLAAPPLFVVFLLEISLAVVSRNLPQLNVFTLGAPLKIAAGLLVLGFIAPHLSSVAGRIFDGLFSFMEGVL